MLPLGVVEWNCYRVRLIGCYFDVEIEKNLWYPKAFFALCFRLISSPFLDFQFAWCYTVITVN
jgi:hypothetical protein